MPHAHISNSGQIRPLPTTGGGSGLEYLQASAGLGQSFTPLAPFGASPDGLGMMATYQPRQVSSGALSLGGSPLVRAAQKLMQNRKRSLRGFGDDAAPVVAATDPGTLQPAASAVTTGAAAAPAVAAGVLLAAVALDLALCGVAGYYVGKAVAPSSSKEQKYAWWGVAAGLIGGPLGLGIEACVALNHKGDR